jgi:hypothetical protein
MHAFARWVRTQLPFAEEAKKSVFDHRPSSEADFSRSHALWLAQVLFQNLICVINLPH